ncbi:MAG: hypothetical protein K2Y28_13215 [Burkholderiaceae bacterium]|nr:hypothetical protein [Burkholderiaceae bacterium]
MTIQFQAHGKFYLRIDQDLLITEVQGPWNAELVKLWAQETRPLVEKLAEQGNWASLAIVKGSLLSTPEAMTILSEVMHFAVINRNMIASAKVITSEVEGFGLVEPSFRQMYTNLCPFDFFDDADSAAVWLRQFLQHKRSLYSIT